MLGNKNYNYVNGQIWFKRTDSAYTEYSKVYDNSCIDAEILLLCTLFSI